MGCLKFKGEAIAFKFTKLNYFYLFYIIPGLRGQELIRKDLTEPSLKLKDP